MKVFSRFSIAFVFCLLFFAVTVTKQAHAQTTSTPLSNFSTADVNPNVPQNIHSLTQIVTTEVLSTLVCQLSGIDMLNKNQACLGVDPKTNKIGFAPNNGGLIGATATGIAMEFQLPIHSTDYVQYMVGKFGNHAFAATNPPTGGMGFTGLLPLIGLWSAFRNIVYLLFVIIFVLVGIAIMLRVQIDPRTVMTLENQLPKIVIGLILVTFSYAIAGVLVDLMWLLTFLVVNVVAGTDTSFAGQLTKVATNELLQGPLGYVNNIFDHNFNGQGGVLDISGTAAHAIYDIVHNIFTTNNIAKISDNQTPTADVNLVTLFTGGLLAFLGAVFGFIFGLVLGLLGFLIVLIALLITMFRVWFALLQAFAYILLDVILAPFHIAAGLIPGSSIGFGSWIRGLTANLLAFPTVVFMFVLARVLLDAFYTIPQTQAVNGVGGGSLFEPPLIGSFNGNGAGNPLGAFVALAIIFATPAVMGVVKKALQVQESGLGGAAFGSVGAGGRAGGGLVKNISGSIGAYTYKMPVAGARAGVRGIIDRFNR